MRRRRFVSVAGMAGTAAFAGSRLDGGPERTDPSRGAMVVGGPRA